MGRGNRVENSGMPPPQGPQGNGMVATAMGPMPAHLAMQMGMGGGGGMMPGMGMMPGLGMGMGGMEGMNSMMMGGIMDPMAMVSPSSPSHDSEEPIVGDWLQACQAGVAPEKQFRNVLYP
jgi:hypothetical protein